jgi:hypothetical protein
MLSTRKLQHAASLGRRGLKAETRAEDTNSGREQMHPEKSYLSRLLKIRTQGREIYS